MITYLETGNKPSFSVNKIKNILTEKQFRELVNLNSDFYFSFLRRTGNSVSVILPVKNEEKNLPYVLPSIKKYATELIIVDGHSRDNTIKVAKELYPTAKIIVQSRKGKTNAIMEGIENATGSICVVIDGDGSHDPSEIPMYVIPIIFGYDFVKGSRFIKNGRSYDITPLRIFGNTIFNLLTSLACAKWFTDVTYGYFSFKREIFDHISIMKDGFEGELEMMIKVVKKGHKIVEVPSIERRRFFGTSNLSSFKDGLKYLEIILTSIFTITS